MWSVKIECNFKLYSKKKKKQKKKKQCLYILLLFKIFRLYLGFVSLFCLCFISIDCQGSHQCSVRIKYFVIVVVVFNNLFNKNESLFLYFSSTKNLISFFFYKMILSYCLFFEKKK